ncbi:MAG: hypothetical protein KJ833_08870, partial [Alphaproteobacteria bacterium]|nr:hypothetical protein [Alphaproteobacteria bacterium]
LNEYVTEIEAPELRLLKRGPLLGFEDVHAMRAREAIEFARSRLQVCLDAGTTPDNVLVADLAALIIAKTGANAALFPVHEGRVSEPRLTILPESILEAVRARLAEGAKPDIRQIWPRAA